MADDVNAEAARKLFTALGTWDVDTYESLLAEDAVEGRPQLRLRFLGRHNIIGMYRNFPGPIPTVVWRTIRGGGELWIAEGTMSTGDQETHELVAIYEFRDGKAVRGDLYFAALSPPPSYHLQWAETVEG